MKRYEEYKPSGISWIGEIPEHWNIGRLRSNFEIVNGNGFPERLQGKSQGKYPFYKVSDINKDHMFAEISNNYVEDDDVTENKWNIVKANSILTAKIGEALKKNHRKICKTKCLIDNNMIALSPKSHEPKYSFYFFSIVNFGYFANPGAVPSMSMDFLKNCPVLLLPLAEQLAIANYLDRKTAQINDLIAKKQRLIDLLNEEKTAIINHAVTKGLNPDAPMKDSGIPWMGEIPAHWELKRLKLLGQIKYGLGTLPKLKPDGLRLIRATDIQRGEISDNEMVFLDPEDVPYDRDPVLKKGDIVVVRSGAYTGDSAIIPVEYEGSVVGYDMVVRVTHANAFFISYCLLSHYVLNAQICRHRLRAAQPHLNREELGETLILLPRDGEQNDIIDFIRGETLDIKMTILEIRREIELLQEYRTALINEAVTGKIDVRGTH